MRHSVPFPEGSAASAHSGGLGGSRLRAWIVRGAYFDGFSSAASLLVPASGLVPHNIYKQLVNSVVSCVVNIRHKPACAPRVESYQRSATSDQEARERTGPARRDRPLPERELSATSDQEAREKQIPLPQSRDRDDSRGRRDDSKGRSGPPHSLALCLPFAFSHAKSNYSRTSEAFARKSNHSRTYAKTGGRGCLESDLFSFNLFVFFDRVDYFVT